MDNLIFINDVAVSPTLKNRFPANSRGGQVSFSVLHHQFLPLKEYLSCLVWVAIAKEENMRIATERAIRLLLLFCTIAAAAAWAAAASVNTTLPGPGCSQSCGQLALSFPFGIEPGCYRNGFAISCDRSDPSSPKAFLGSADSTIQVTHISAEQSQARVLVPITWECYNRSDYVVGSQYPYIDFNIDGAGVFRMATGRNKLTVIGCNSEGHIQSQADVNGSYSYRYYTGCVTYCRDAGSVVDGVCAGIGCCQISFPSNLSDSSFRFSGYSHSGDMADFSPCSYVFIVDKDYFNFTSADLKMNTTNASMPMWLDWAFRDAATCEEAKNSSSNYANNTCRSQNSMCVDSDNGAGYLCNCSRGYQGNPYLDDGCLDIDECLSPENYPCHGVCTNLEGSYRCECPSGKHGDPFIAPCTSRIPMIGWLFLGIASCLFIAICFILICLFGQKRRYESMISKENQRLREEKRKLICYKDIVSKYVSTMILFSLQDLQKATNYFNGPILGEGAYGVVFKGRLEEGPRDVAIKKTRIATERQSDKDKKGFWNEINLLSHIKHKNVVVLYGCCFETPTPLLVYEFVPNGSLFDLLHKKKGIISLKRRLKIAEESAEALAYLHSFKPHPIVHGDVKPHNILLDHDWAAKVADFGISKLLSENQTEALTHAEGTPGYADPVLVKEGLLSTKNDVYSFGIVLLELVTRKQPADGLASMGKEEAAAALDKQILNEENIGLLQAVVDLAARCLSPEKEDRPTMEQVAIELKGYKETLSYPKEQREQDEFVDQSSSLLNGRRTFRQ
ncbi:wall-associated receptor kinase 5-like [Zingiber officinale]|uniref:wall-associated receptor kinase 5-like n=1 Tax=Zingiber officinale TaxID=94328 RepID=UPI001C4D6D33|nr:wall-associated receptor kinase 5-like [Zingiber officinale]